MSLWFNFPKPMQLKRQNILLVLTAIVLGGAFLLTRSPEDAPNADTTDLFTFEERDIQAMDIDTPARNFAFAKDENGVWRMTEPEAAIANDATVAFLANLLATSTSDQTLTTAPDNLAAYGLDRPFATLDITLANDQTHQLVLGTFNFDQSRLYAQVNPEAESSNTEETDAIEVLLVPADFETAINRPLEEWLPEAEAEPEPEPDEAETAPGEGE